jgi:hypothetical protein
LQLFETLEPALQTALRLAAPMETFSEVMLADVGLPSKIVRRLAHLFNMAVDEGILELYARAIPKEVHAADPTAARAWGWRMGMLRQEVLSSLLASEVQRVELKIEELCTFHSRRAHERSQGSSAQRALAFADAGNGMRRQTFRSEDSSQIMSADFDAARSATEAPVWHTRTKTSVRQVGVQCDLGPPAANGTPSTALPNGAHVGVTETSQRKRSWRLLRKLLRTAPGRFRSANSRQASDHV